MGNPSAAGATLLLLLLLLSAAPAAADAASGACVYHGSLFENSTVWKPDSCQDCRCWNSVVTCEPTVCKSPQCDFQKGEVLQIASNKCCPECASRAEGFCQHKGQIHSHGTQWASSGCAQCSCAHGKVTCSPRTCPALTCGQGELQDTAQGSCCPKCVGRGEPCSFDGHVFQDGEGWSLGRCSRCVCRDGATQCSTASCQPLLCSQDEVMLLSPGKCCPECVPKPCLVSGRTFQHGEQWKKNACTACACQRGEVRCLRETCGSVTCEKGENKVQRPGKCCEECVSSKGSCLDGGTIRYHGEMWNSTHCDFCMCQEGQVTCQGAECAKVECAKGEELIHLDGKCCPECISSHSYCVYKEHTKANGETWAEGPCRECECRDAEVTCFQRSCPPCPKGSLPLEVKGDCCPRCQPGECHPDCVSCSQASDHCDSCRDTKKLLQDGRCVETCEWGFYQHGGTCLACNETCLACTNGFECSSCQTSLLLKNGQCVTSCGKGYVQDQLLCTACHESCSSCWGAAENNCLSCKDPSHVLKEGLCLASCGQGFYPKDGICTACGQFCERCSSDPARCVTCAAGKLLHDGKCIPQCPDGYFPSGSGRCRACHASCSTCEGPLATHCTSCSFPLALRQGQCLESCGEGFYQDHNICKGCHPSCRSCAGPGAARCLQCQAPEDVLQPHLPRQGALHGLCLPHCQPQFHVDSTGVCRECHSSCAGCVGNSSQDCTACPASHVLLEGRCLPECPEGLFSHGDHCSSCHPSCKTCHGPSDWECSTCHPHATLDRGKCRTSCKEEQYLNMVGYCVDCHPLCRQCVANLRDTGSVCLKCQNTRHLLLGDHCLPDCPLGHYAQNGACKRCHPSCKTCTGQGPFSCSSCNTSLVLSHTGACAPLCSPGYYRDDRQTCRRECLSSSHLSFPQCTYRHVFSCSFAPRSCCLEKKGFKYLKTRCELTEVMSCLRSRAYSTAEIRKQLQFCY